MQRYYFLLRYGQVFTHESWNITRVVMWAMTQSSQSSNQIGVSNILAIDDHIIRLIRRLPNLDLDLTPLTSTVGMLSLHISQQLTQEHAQFYNWIASRPPHQDSRESVPGFATTSPSRTADRKTSPSPNANMPPLNSSTHLEVTGIQWTSAGF